MNDLRPTKDFPTVTELLVNVRGGEGNSYTGTDGGYCSTDDLVNAANGRTAFCPRRQGSSAGS